MSLITQYHPVIIGRGQLGKAIGSEFDQRSIPYSIYGRNTEEIFSTDKNRFIFINFNEKSIETEKHFKNLFLNLNLTKNDKIIYISSGGAIYGNQVNFPIFENAKELPITEYGKKKLLGEKVLKQLCYDSNNSLTILRPGNIYDGEGASNDMVSTLIRCYREQKDFNLVNSGEAIRDFVLKTDFAFATVEIATKCENGIFNIGTGVGTKVLDVITMFNELTGYKLKINYLTASILEVKKSILSSAKLESKIQWTPEIMSRKTLEKIIFEGDLRSLNHEDS